MEFEWDPAKNERNIAQHGVTFAFAARAFASRMIQWRDSRVDYGEERWSGLVELEFRVYVVVWTMRGADQFRIISARKANERETKRFYRETRVVEAITGDTNEP